MVDLIWATSGREWGFRFMLNGGYADPLHTYETAFAGLDGESAICRRVGKQVALRFPDPLGRSDASGRVIPHDFVVMTPLADLVDSVDAGLREVWPIVADSYAQVWDSDRPPSVVTVDSDFYAAARPEPSSQPVPKRRSRRRLRLRRR